MAKGGASAHWGHMQQPGKVDTVQSASESQAFGPRGCDGATATGWGADRADTTTGGGEGRDGDDVPGAEGIGEGRSGGSS